MARLTINDLERACKCVEQELDAWWSHDEVPSDAEMLESGWERYKEGWARPGYELKRVWCATWCLTAKAAEGATDA